MYKMKKKNEDEEMYKKRRNLIGKNINNLPSVRCYKEQ